MLHSLAGVPAGIVPGLDSDRQGKAFLMFDRTRELAVLLLGSPWIFILFFSSVEHGVLQVPFRSIPNSLKVPHSR